MAPQCPPKPHTQPNTQTHQHLNDTKQTNQNQSKGTSYNRPTISGKMVHLSMMANPSHLEAVNTVVLGKTRAKQHFSDDASRSESF